MNVGTNLGHHGPIKEKPWKAIRVFKDEVYAANGSNLFTLSDPFNPYYIQELEVYDCIRFLHWTATNDILDKNWSDRVKKTDSQEVSGANDEGCSIELMIALSNRVNRDMWFNVPHLTIDRNGASDYIKKFAILVKTGVDMKSVNLDKLGDLTKLSKQDFIKAGGIESCAPLKSNLKLYVEYSNETWNENFPQFQHIYKEGLALNLDTEKYKAAFKYHAWAACRMWDEVEAVFGKESSRIYKVDAFQPSYSQVEYHLEILRNPKYNKNGTLPDVFSCNAYFGNSLKTGATPDIMTRLINDLNTVRVPKWKGVREAVDAAKKADGRNYLFYAYEGGQHVWKKGADVCNRDPKIYGVYQKWLAECEKWFDGVAHFQHGGEHSDGFAWGVVENTTGAGYDLSQPTIEKTIANYPKYRALVEFINGSNPKPANRAPVARAGADLEVNDSDGNGTQSVTLDGSASSDADGDSLSYNWSWGISGAASGKTTSKTFPVGTTTVTLTVSDGSASDTDTVLVKVTEKGNPDPIPSGDLTAMVSGSTVNLDWPDYSGSGNFDNYRVYRGGEILKWWVVDSNYTDEGVSNGTYSYEVVAWDNRPNSEGGKNELQTWSTTVTVGGTTPDPDPVPSGDLTAAVSGSTVSLDWPDYSGSGNFNNYRIYRGGEILNWWVLDSNYIDSNVGNGTYAYEVVAWDNRPRTEGGKVELQTWSASVTVGGTTPVPNPDPTPAGPNLYIEAEDADSTANLAPFKVTNDAAASGDKVLYWANDGTDQTDTTPSNADSGQAPYSFTLTDGVDKVDIYILVDAPSALDDSVYVKLSGEDSNWVQKNGLKTSGYQWKKVGGYYGVSAGDYTFTILKREDGIKIDRIFIATDGSDPK